MGTSENKDTGGYNDDDPTHVALGVTWDTPAAVQKRQRAAARMYMSNRIGVDLLLTNPPLLPTKTPLLFDKVEAPGLCRRTSGVCNPKRQACPNIV